MTFNRAPGCYGRCLLAVAVAVMLLFLGGGSIGCTTNPAPRYAAPNLSIDKVAMLRSESCRIRLIDGAQPDQGMRGTRPVAVVPGKRTVIVEWTSQAVGDTSMTTRAQFDIDFKAAHQYRIAAKTTDYRLFAWAQEVVLIDETAGTMLYLSGGDTGLIRPYEVEGQRTDSQPQP
jgi:hypothetical protein